MNMLHRIFIRVFNDHLCKLFSMSPGSQSMWSNNSHYYHHHQQQYHLVRKTIFRASSWAQIYFQTSSASLVLFITPNLINWSRTEILTFATQDLSPCIQHSTWNKVSSEQILPETGYVRDSERDIVWDEGKGAPSPTLWFLDTGVGSQRES